MSNLALKSEMEILIKRSGFKKSKSMICPIAKLMSMRHSNVSSQQIHKVIKSIL